MIKVFAGVLPWMLISLLHLSFIKGKASSCKRYNYRERVWCCNIDDSGASQFRDPRKLKRTEKPILNKDL